MISKQMNALKILKKIPFIKNKISILKPKIENILLEFFDKESAINYLDIGANRGQSIDFITNIFINATIYSFEPTPELFIALQQKYSSYKNVHVFDLALADKDGKIDFYQSNFSPTNSCLEPNTSLYKDFDHKITETLENSSKLKVDGKKLDTWYKQNLSNEIIDIVKIDTQGTEYNVIQGGLNILKDKVKLLYFEIQYLDFYKNAKPFYKTFELLYDNNFYYYCHIPSNRRNKYQVLESDVFFINNNFKKPFE